ncbi:MAG: sulfatase [Pseudomonadota bacterium]
MTSRRDSGIHQRLITFWLMLLMLPAQALPAGSRPNVVLIVADDLGWADSALYGQLSQFDTPNLMWLAEQGIRFSRAYASSPLCSPSRASILTGQTPTRHGISRAIRRDAPPRFDDAPGGAVASRWKVSPNVPANRLASDEPTLPKVLKQAGYATGHFGKWHLGASPFDPAAYSFDVAMPGGTGPGPMGGYLAPWEFPKLRARAPGEHIDERLASEAVRWVKSLHGEPFFLNFWMYSVHAPFQARRDKIAAHRSRFTPEARQASATYAAMVEHMDDALGILLTGLSQVGVLDRTIIVFTSDNGGNMSDGVREPFPDGERVVTPTSNYPLRGGKGTIYEGGIRVPMVALWFGVTPPGSETDVIMQQTDLYPTILALAGAVMPKDYPLDGVDLSSVLRGESTARPPMFTFFPQRTNVPDWLPPSAAVHLGRWKLLRLFGQAADGTDVHRLYDLTVDQGEQHDVAVDHPAVVTRMAGYLDDHIDQAGGTVPVRNPAFEPDRFRPQWVGKQRGGLRVRN